MGEKLDVATAAVLAVLKEFQKKAILKSLESSSLGVKELTFVAHIKKGYISSRKASGTQCSHQNAKGFPLGFLGFI